MTANLTDRDVASHFGISWQQVQARCKAKEWPHIKVGRSYRFTPELISQIEAMGTVQPEETAEPADTWGRKKRGAA